jgi:hypothetical protein
MAPKWDPEVAKDDHSLMPLVKHYHVIQALATETNFVCRARHYLQYTDLQI